MLIEFRKIGDRCVIFSGSISTLNYIQQMLRFLPYDPQSHSAWRVLRFDGSTPAAERTQMIKEFNLPQSHENAPHVFLISTKGFQFS